MDEKYRKLIWSLIQKKGDLLKDKLEPHASHPNGRNPYAHICSLINQRFKCSYKDLSNEKVEELKKFILKINK